MNLHVVGYVSTHTFISSIFFKSWSTRSATLFELALLTSELGKEKYGILAELNKGKVVIQDKVFKAPMV